MSFLSWWISIVFVLLVVFLSGGGLLGCSIVSWRQFCLAGLLDNDDGLFLLRLLGKNGGFGGWCAMG